MSDVVVYHPGTGGAAAVPPEAVPHLRKSGWLLLSEHQRNEDERTAREEAAAGGGKGKSKSKTEEGEPS